MSDHFLDDLLCASPQNPHIRRLIRAIKKGMVTSGRTVMINHISTKDCYCLSKQEENLIGNIVNVNQFSGLSWPYQFTVCPQLWPILATFKRAYVIMHRKGNPWTGTPNGDTSPDRYEQIRQRIKSLIVNSRSDGYATVSNLLGRSHSYIQQYITRKSPKILKAADRRKIAEHFGIPVRDLMLPEDFLDPTFLNIDITPTAAAATGADMAPETKSGGFGSASAYAGATSGAIAGAVAGVLPEAIPLPADWIEKRFRRPPQQVSYMTITSDSMTPTLRPRDQILVDHLSPRPVPDGLYVIMAGSTMQPCRITHHPTTGRAVISYDNPLYPDHPDCEWTALNIIGRIIWCSRTLD